MENSQNTKNDQEDRQGGFKSFFTTRVILGIGLAVGILWMVSLLLGSFDHKPPQVASAPEHQTASHVQPSGSKTEHLEATPQPPKVHATARTEHQPEPGVHATAPMHAPRQPAASEATHQAPAAEQQAKAPVHASAAPTHTTAVPATPESHQAAPAHPVTAVQPSVPVHTQESTPAAHLPSASADTHGAHGAPVKTFPAPGMALIDAIIQPMDNELHHHFWGWRPNDILDFTDNVNNFQLGVLEVTRRSAVILAERISRTGSTASFDTNLQTAMNWFMVKADRYWFPSPESKYSAGLEELREYFHRLEKGEATFYSRSDNLIPLLMAYEDLLGSCDENLVKFTEDDGSPVSYFKADNYFFYAKGVASAMVTILEAVMVDFSTVIETREGTEVLHHAIESLHHAVDINPWLITDSNLSGILANHRSNMAAPISHARFYLGVLIKALST